MSRRKQTFEDPVAKELADIKRLIALLMLKIGVSQAEVADALGIDQSAVSRMFSVEYSRKDLFR